MKTKMWITYGEEVRLFKDDWYIFITKAIVAPPHEHEGKAFFRYLITRHRDQKDKYALWKDKNPRARKFETKHFLSLQEARDTAFEEIQKRQTP